MRLTVVATSLAAVVTAHPQGGSLLGIPLDIGALLKSLGPAPASDPRFTTFTPPGSGDGNQTPSSKQPANLELF